MIIIIFREVLFFVIKSKITAERSTGGRKTPQKEDKMEMNLKDTLNLKWFLHKFISREFDYKKDILTNINNIKLEIYYLKVISPQYIFLSEKSFYDIHNKYKDYFEEKIKYTLNYKLESLFGMKLIIIPQFIYDDLKIFPNNMVFIFAANTKIIYELYNEKIIESPYNYISETNKLINLNNLDLEEFIVCLLPLYNNYWNEILFGYTIKW